MTLHKTVYGVNYRTTQTYLTPMLLDLATRQRTFPIHMMTGVCECVCMCLYVLQFNLNLKKHGFLPATNLYTPVI